MLYAVEEVPLLEGYGMSQLFSFRKVNFNSGTKSMRVLLYDLIQ